MFPVFHVRPVCAWPAFQRNSAMETLNNISTTCVVESWRNHLFRFLNHLFWPTVESCHSVCSICHRSIVRCPCAIQHNINFSSRVECKCRLYHHWFPQKIYCLMNHILSTFFSSTHFYLIRHFWRFCWNIYFLLFRWFKFTLKPPYSRASERSLSAIWDTSHWNFFVKFGLKTAWDISYDILLSLLKFVNFWRLQGHLSILAKIGCLQKIKVFSMKERRGFNVTLGF